jgi:hypothetical protein
MFLGQRSKQIYHTGIQTLLVGWFVGLEARQLLRLFAPIYNWGEIYSCDVYIKNNKKIKTKGKAV